MLTSLRIKNLALVADLTLDLQPGYNVITGETGAGKSILIGALSLVLGERADRTLIRSGSDNCSVEAVFDVSRLKAPLKSFLDENGLEPCEEHQLVLKRTFTAAGANRQFINGSPTTLNTLAALGESLVDIHGPHEHQSLLHPARQLAILDAFGKLEPGREAFAGLLRRRAVVEAEKAALIVDEKTYAQQLDLLRFQVNEITTARLQTGEEEQVERDYRRANNAAKLLQLGQTALELLSENETSLLSQAGLIGRTLQELQRVDTSAAALLALHEQAVSTLRDLQADLSHYSEKLDIDPARLQELEERLNLLHSLKRKYGAGVAEINAFGEEAGRKLKSLEQRDAELARLNADLSTIEAELWRAGQALSAKRRKVIPPLSKAAAGQLAALGFKQSRFDIVLATIDENPFIHLDPSTPGHASRVTHHASKAAEPAPHSSPPLPRLSSTGFDTVEFQFAPNPGEPPRPLRAIASSGELARVMLALKTVLAAEDQIPVLVFDEVDANVGGETAHAVGEKMRQIAQKRQVLCITHLPQVAAPADAHFVAAKEVKDGRTISEITRLEGPERVKELARMLGGQTEAARIHAEALLK
ncbi:MAG TPA: DNA repair protein RecN [Candidatus Acidoferrum sp.]|jgi:DNA repair protein RecN (Recombination protein N)|nr:DNA repair protein RecN [Candidatus Acidoferrum sp.]